jgi:hypothetical protein
MVRTIYLATLPLLSSLISARAVLPGESVANIAHSKRQDSGDLTINEVNMERLHKARNSDLDSTGPTPEQPEEPQHLQIRHQPYQSRQAGKTLQLFWEVAPASRSDPMPPLGVPPIAEPNFQWYFYLGDANKGSDPCNSDPIDTNFEAPKGDNPPVVVDGEWEFDVPELGKCKYQGIGKVGPAGDNGWLHCPGRPAIMCVPDKRVIDKCNSDTTIKSKAISHCDW